MAFNMDPMESISVWQKYEIILILEHEKISKRRTSKLRGGF